MQPLPLTEFHSSRRPGLGIEVMSLDTLYRRLPAAPGVEQMNFFLLLLFTAGRGEHLVDFSPVPWQAGTVLAVGKGQVQQFAPRLTGRGWLVLFTEDFVIRTFRHSVDFRNLRLFDEALLTPATHLSAVEHATVVHHTEWLHAEYAPAPAQPYQEELLRGGLHTLLLLLERARSSSLAADPHPHALFYLQFRRLVREQVRRQRQVADYARQLGFSTKKLNYVCQHVAHCSAKQVITQQLVLEAKRLLAGSALSVKEVAYALGFDEPTNFVKYFQKQTRQTPGQFRA